MALKKVKRAGKAVVLGYSDYAKEMKAINKEAEKLAGKSGSRNADAAYSARIGGRLKKERGVSLINSIKKRY
jgi:hypothetical protein